MNVRPSTVLLCCAAAGLAACGGDQSTSADSQNTYHVVREDLPLTVKENAELQAIRETVVRSEVEGTSTILYLIEEGSMVQEGERLFELDVSELVEKRSSQEIAVEKARSAWEQARTQQEILEKELIAKRNTASSQLLIAGMELEKFLGAEGDESSTGRNLDMVRRLRDLIETPTPEANPAEANAGATRTESAPPTPAMTVTKVDPRNYKELIDKVVALLQVEGAGNPLQREMGEMANKILQQVDQIRLAMAELKMREDTVSHSRSLAARQFITRNELERHELDYQSQESRVTIAWKDLELLINYTLPTDRIQLEQNLENAKLELERVDAQNDAERKKSAFDVDAKNKEYVVAKERLENLATQIGNAICYAPTPGVVVYARLNRDRRGGEAVTEGAQVRERQEIIILPDNTRMRCDVKVQEAQVDRVTIGQPAHITVEAFPNEIFTGRVTRVAPVADSGSSWGGTDKKVYTTIVDLDGENADGRLRSRMAAGVTITVGIVKNTLTVPQQAVRRDRSINYVWKLTKAGPQAVPVKVGAHNQEKVEVLEGVQEGDVVYRTPPGGQPEPKFDQPELPQGVPMPAVPTEPEAGDGGRSEALGNGAREGRGPGGEGGRGPRGGRGAMLKKYADMTPEELEEAKAGLDRWEGMLARIEDPDAARKFETTLQDLRKALEENDLETAQTHRDSLMGAMRAAMPRRAPGEGRTPGGDGGEGRRPGGDGGGFGGRRGGER